MKKELLLLSCWLLLGSFQSITAHSQQPTVTTDSPVVVAYVTSWTDIMPNPGVVTHLNYAFGHVNNSFNGVRIDNEERLKQLVELKKKAPHLKVLLSIGGWGSGRFSEMAADDTLRKQFANDCRRVIDAFNLDGIDIDWEYPTQDMSGISASPNDTENYTMLMRDIREAIGSAKLLTHATVASAEYMDHRALDAYVDFTNVMAYDMGNPPSHHAALYRSERVGGLTADDAVKAHLAAGVPRSKLVLGMPLYGRAAPTFQRPKDPTKAHEMEGYTAHWDTTAMVPFLTDSTGKMVFCYENSESLTIKCRYILEQGLLGGMYWEYGNDNEAGDLTRTIYETLAGSNDKKETIRLAFISGMHPVFDTALYAPVLNDFKGVTWKAYTHEESQELFKQENKDKYDIIIFYAICLEKIPETTKQDIIQVVSEGKPVFILHDGLLTYNTWPEFANIAGMKYFMSEQTVNGVTFGVSKYKHRQDIPITVADKDHFITQGMDSAFVLHDEIYDGLWEAPGIHALWTTTHPESTRHVMYTHTYGKAKVAGIVVGHGPDIFFDKNFRLAFQRTVWWLAGKQ
jgi:chitinase